MESKLKCSCGGEFKMMTVSATIKEADKKFGLSTNQEVKELNEEVPNLTALMFSMLSPRYQCDKCKTTQGFYQTMAQALVPLDALPQGDHPMIPKYIKNRLKKENKKRGNKTNNQIN